MPTCFSSRAHPAVMAIVALAVGACTVGGAAPAWTFGQSTSAPSVATPTPNATVIPPTLVATAHATPVAATPSTATPKPAPTASGAPSYQPGLTDEEWASFATPWGIRHATMDPPPVSAAMAEAIVRGRYAGNRPLVWSGLVTYGDTSRVGWMVVLGIATGQACALHPGLLDRALEGGIVDAATGEIFFTMTCG